MKNIIPFSSVRNRTLKKRSYRRKTSPNSFWYFGSEEIKKKFDYAKIEEAYLRHPWNIEEIDERFQNAKPHNLQLVGLERLFMPMKPEYILYDLFKGDDLNSFLRGNTFRVERNIKVGNELIDASLIIPNPNRVKEGRTKDGRLSSCCRDAIGKRRYLVVESNHPSLDEKTQASVICYLSNSFKDRLKMIVQTPNAPLQAWFLADSTEHKNWLFMSEAVELGANTIFWRPETPARMPNGICRETGELQSCIYYDFEISNLEEVA